MSPESVQDAVAALLVADPTVEDRDGVAAIVRRSRMVRSWLSAVDVQCARRTAQVTAAGRSEPAPDLLGDEGNRSTKDAANIQTRAHACDALPAFEAALATGQIAEAHVDAVARALRLLTGEIRAAFIHHEGQLLATAKRERIEQFERTCRDLARLMTAEHDRATGDDQQATDDQRKRDAANIRHWLDASTGMHHTHLELDAERAARLRAALRVHLRRVRKRDGNSGRPWSELEVDAFMSALDAGITRQPSARPTPSPATADAGDRALGGDDPVPFEPDTELRVPDITILVDHLTLHDGQHGDTVCESSDGTPLPVDTVCRLCCDAEITLLSLDRDGAVHDLGRTRRTLNRSQRRALRAMHRTCVGPGCEVPFDDCQIHHVQFWRNGGPTDVANLAPVCSRHHHLAHEGGWTLAMTADRIVTWTRPDGTVHWTGSGIDRAPRGAPPTRDPNRLVA